MPRHIGEYRQVGDSAAPSSRRPNGTAPQRGNAGGQRRQVFVARAPVRKGCPISNQSGELQC
jgi:hypothetical protein